MQPTRSGSGSQSSVIPESIELVHLLAPMLAGRGGSEDRWLGLDCHVFSSLLQLLCGEASIGMLLVLFTSWYSPVT